MTLRGDIQPKPTARELRILALICEGMTVREAGRRIGVSENTAKKHLSNLYRRLGITSGRNPGHTHAILAARLQGWLKVPAEFQPEAWCQRPSFGSRMPLSYCVTHGDAWRFDRDHCDTAMARLGDSSAA